MKEQNAIPTAAALLFLYVLTALTGCAPQQGAREARPTSDTIRAQPIRPNSAISEPVEVRILDVGQGDAILIRSAPAAGSAREEEHVALIDAGPANRIVGQLRALGVRHIDLLLASHNHADHIGGMDAILDSIPVRYYMDNGHPASTRIQQRVLERVEAKGVVYLQPRRRTLTVGSARLHVLPAPEGARSDDQNNRSLTVRLEVGRFQALLPGDAETELLNRLLETGEVPRVDVLKAAHHGSRNGVTPAWLSRTRPHVVAISLAENNSYGHPHERAMRYYCAGGRMVLRTDQEGDIIIRVDSAGTYTVQTERNRTVAPPAERGATTACSSYSAADTAAVEGR
ncbi:MAG: MBL fold metallo-hydrolase [Gemmatimonadetes bacterium]|nr:MBL fold metallo-hydrolase [Gemmatimonadota bacterium]